MSDGAGDGTGHVGDDRAAERDHVLLQALFELTTVGIQLIDVDRQCAVGANPALQRITGYSHDELVKGDPRDRFPPQWWPVRESWFRDAFEHGRFGPSEVEYIHRDGHLINLVFSGVRVTDAARHNYLWLNIQDVTRFRRMERELRAAASEDRLTGLANRATLLRALQRRVSEAGDAPDAAGDFAVMFLDFDRFKLVNDTLGHDAGDALLCGIAERLRAAAEQRGPATGRGEWVAARFGGDEFVLLVSGVPDELAARREADALLAALAQPYRIKQQEVHSSASIGIARWQPGSSADAMLRDADIAMYEAKRRGRGGCVIFDAGMRERLTRAMLIERELHHALPLGQLSLLWQPMVSLDTGDLCAAEALLRWQHPTLGDVAPAEFLPVASDSGLLSTIGRWVLEETCRQWRRWQTTLGPDRAPPMVSVNLPRTPVARHRHVVEAVRLALGAVDMPPQALQIEMAEQAVLHDGAGARALMEQLRALGVRLAMDDFGSGSSSLACLRDFPFDVIKIHRSFVTGLVRDPHALAVAHATVNVIENLGLASVAVGIDDPSELAALQSMGCRCGQGALFSPPVNADALPDAVERRRRELVAG